mmetsp:Transcript_34485/g.60586  ORF Transcript_34485/g.60586 Transcript_34485/m.60586 type:complete len:405 (-) Transcript_34485:3833-5047(-)
MADDLGEWPGSVEGCYCSYNGDILEGFCDSSLVERGCTDVNSTSKSTLRVWRNRVLCLLRSGTSIYWAPTPNSDGTCDTEEDIYGNDVEFIQCGKDNAAFCAEKELGCPINQVLLQSSQSPRPSEFNYSVYFGDDLVLYYQKADEESTVLPIIDVKISEGLACYDKPHDQYSANRTYYPLLESTPSKCDYVDDRYTVLDNITFDRYLSENDYQNITELPALDLDSQSNMMLSYRRSILWKEKCTRGEYARSNLNNLDHATDEAEDLQLLLLVVDVILALYLVVIDPLLWIVSLRFTREKIDEFSERLVLLSLLEKMTKIISIPFVSYVAFRVAFLYSWYYDLEHYCCSDPLTNSSFDIVDFSLSDAYRYNWANFALTIGILFADAAFGVIIFVSKVKHNYSPVQ